MIPWYLTFWTVLAPVALVVWPIGAIIVWRAVTSDLGCCARRARKG